MVAQNFRPTTEQCWMANGNRVRRIQKWICLRLSESRLGGLVLCTGGREVRAGIGLVSTQPGQLAVVDVP